MAKCTHCQKTILMGGMKVGSARFCGEKCADAALVPPFEAAYGSTEVVATPVPMPRDQRRGPDDAALVDHGSSTAVVIAIGIAVAVLLSIGIHFVEDALAFDLRGLNWLIVLPIGALLNGAAITVGFFAASRLLNAPPKPVTYVAALMTAGLLCWLKFGIVYFTMVDDTGAPIRSSVGFIEFMRFVIENTEVSLTRSKNSAVQTGSWGYALYAADWLGFMAGAWFVVGKAASKAFCARCSRFMTRICTTTRSSDDPAATGATLRTVEENLKVNNPQQAIDALGSFGAPNTKSFFSVALDCHGCPMCGNYAATLSTSLAGAKARRETYSASFEGNSQIKRG